ESSAEHRSSLVDNAGNDARNNSNNDNDNNNNRNNNNFVRNNSNNFVRNNSNNFVRNNNNFVRNNSSLCDSSIQIQVSIDDIDTNSGHPAWDAMD
ncbi:unnamed protein product, partial [Polarella glacialis]